jgi:hypothetical protein
MPNCLKYQVIPELQIILEYLAGHIDLNELINFEIAQSEDESYNSAYSNITDLRNAEFIVTENAIKKYVDFVKKTEKMISYRKVAFIVGTPSQTALTILYAQLVNHLPINNKVFSTLEAAMNWIGLKINDQQLVQKTLESLKYIEPA